MCLWRYMCMAVHMSLEAIGVRTPRDGVLLVLKWYHGYWKPHLGPLQAEQTLLNAEPFLYHQLFFVCLFICLFVLRQDLSEYPWWSQKSTVKGSYPWTHKDPLTLTSWVLGTTIPNPHAFLMATIKKTTVSVLSNWYVVGMNKCRTSLS